jgi:hypothetical protein
MLRMGSECTQNGKYMYSEWEVCLLEVENTCAQNETYVYSEWEVCVLRTGVF